MNADLQSILEKIQNSDLPESEKESYRKSIRDIEKNENLLQFKLGRIEKDRHTLSVMLEESIEDLQKKSKVIEEANAALQNKNKELEIEAALEKVRSSSLAMHHSDELREVAVTVAEKLKELNVEFYTVIIIIFQEGSKDVLWWLRNVENQQHSRVLLRYSDIAYLRDLFHARENGRELFSKCYAREEKKELYRYLFNDTDFKYTPDDQKKVLFGYEFATMSVALAKNTAIHLTRYSDKSFSDEDNEILKKFARVFDQAYTRFLDLQKAEAQAREAQIEAALERVRSRTMAMQRSDELPEASHVLFQQLKELGENAAQLSIGIIKEADQLVEISATVHGSPLLQTYKIPFDEPYVVRKVVRAFKENERSVLVELAGDELRGYNKWRNSFLERKIDFPEETWIVNAVFFSKGFLSFSSEQRQPEKTLQLLERFANVFDATYTRFLDLKNAEAQTREAQIEAALERVRSRTMAMQSSKELPQAANLLFQQIQSLGMPTWSAGYCIWDDDKKAITLWMSSEGVIQPALRMPLTEDPSLMHFREAQQRGEAFFVEAVGGEALKEHYAYLRTLPGVRETLDDIEKAGFPVPTFQIFHLAYFPQGFLLFITYEPVPKAHDIFKRFAKVFEQTYTRFLDLQKAEAQARESQIQLALERARAQSMMMQHSKELDDTLRVFHEQVLALGIKSAFSFLWLPDEEKDRHIFWAAWAEKNSTVFKSKAINYPLDRNEPATAQCLVDWKSNQPVVSYHVPPDGVENYFAAWSELIAGVDQLKPEYFADGLYYVEAFIKYGCFGVMVKSELPEDEKTILYRFAAEFERTYTRFLDLQKAEAQAREAQIEASLERVRSKAMAMHKSEDLSPAVATVFEELDKLHLGMSRCGIGIINKERRSANAWITSIGDQGSTVQISGEESMDLHPLLQGVFAAWLKHQDFSYTLEGDDMKNYYRTSGMGNVKLPESQLILSGNDLKRQFYHIAAFEAGGLFAFRKTTFSEEAKSVMKRFANVFNLTYKRFLDIQKAEAQAREAQIEAALERVRSRTMGMQKSEELREVIQVVYEQLVHLNMLVEHAGFIMDYKERDDMHIWLADKHEVPFQVTIPYFDSAHWNSFIEAKEKGTDFFANHLSFEEKNKFYDDLFKLVPGVTEEAKEYYSSCPGLAISTVLLDNVGLYIENFSGVPYSDEENNTLMRFGKVFQQTYTRFLDLKKAEEQARESQIQLALERVRARTMAMQKSEELPETSHILFEQMKELGEPVEQLTIGVVQEENRVIEISATLHGDILKKIYQHSLDEPFMMSKMYHAWKTHQKTLIVELKGDELNAYNKYRNELTKSDMFPTNLGDEHRRIVYAAFFSKGMLALGANEPRPPESLQLLERFAGVFDQAYIRFIDLKNAEAQAREAQIEAALERIRSRSLAMHHTDELKDVITVVREKLKELNVAMESKTVLILTLTEGSKDVKQWIAVPENLSRNRSSRCVETPYFDHPIMSDFWNAKESGMEFYAKVYTFEEKNSFFKFMFEHTNSSMTNEEEKKWILEQGSYTNSTAIEKNSAIIIANYTKQLLSENENEILKRVARVFEQSYVRFLDLQKAEVQAREAQIEAALERVRGKAMAMHNSNDLSTTANTIFNELRKLGIHPVRSGVGLLTKDSYKVLLYAATSSMEGDELSLIGRIDMSRNPYLKMQYQSCIKRENHFPVLKGEELKSYYDDIVAQVGVPPLSDEQLKHDHYGYYFPFSEGYFYAWSESKYSEGDINILNRFKTNVGLTFRRYLDLQKAEGQAREAQIEAALERVRSKAMAMHKTEDFNPAVAVVFEELEKLDLGVLRCGISVLNKETRTGDIWVTSTTDQGSAVQVSGDESFDIHPLLSGAFDAWLRQQDFYYVLEGNDLTNYYEAVRAAHFELPESQFVSSETAYRKQYAYVAVYHAGGLFAFRDAEFPDEAKKVMNRFAKVFDLTYKRFRDLQQAEAQARESQVQLALERVRARTMAMQKSDELSEASYVLFEQWRELGRNIDQISIGIFEDETAMKLYSTLHGNQWKRAARIEYDKHIVYRQIFSAWKEKKKSFVADLSGKDLIDLNKFKIEATDYQIGSEEDLPQDRWIIYVAFFSNGMLSLATEEPHPTESVQLLERFASVFDLTYTRFLDLKKAEAQTREAKIEAAMEKVRARAMAMQKADELIEVSQLLRKEMGLLGVEELETSSIYVHNGEVGTTECWYAIQDIRGPEKKLVADHMTIYLKDTWVGREMLKFYNSDETQTSIVMQGENRKEWINDCAQHSKILQGYYGDVIPERTYHLVKFSNGYMGAASPGDISAESWDLLRRATKVFSLAYTRFSDLQLAEAQAREATVEAALERVRAKAMAMHNSDDVSSAASMVFTELRKLGINPIRCGVGLLNNESLKAPLYSATSSPDGDSLSLVGWVVLDGHPVLEEIYQKWLAGEDYFPELSGESLKSYYGQLLSGLSVPVPDFSNEQRQYGHFFAFSIGCLYAWSDVRYNDDQIRILKRFASIIDLTFRRYLDLQKSEANAREAIKQAALDRIRADIASMRTVSDLDRITPLIWNELTILGLPFIRCGVFLMDDSQQLIHTFLSTPDGKAIGAFHMPYDTPGKLQQVLIHWRANEKYVDHWDDEEFVQFANILLQQGAIASPEQYLKTLPAGGFHLHFLPFLQGMLYVGNTAELNAEQINVVQAVADAFSTAYARYEDFNKLEAAKQQIEKTLVDLKQTQQQLVQSEKMASLGELTAGIAHEIQNPLNFVNNFSEVSNELLDEMKTELTKGNSDDAMVIVEDVKQNLEKILHHGKRADAIVKGMLQHSRTSSGQKELTDINALADEYLRLAYHGLRAKDKTFNAKFETHLDDSIEKINVVPQEVGRVILNLINNAFYAVTEKKNRLNGTYEPTVSISTRRIVSPLGDGGDKVEIRIKDNGGGIPDKLLDKIFQPFFTTKPTGQGTGLGLSLAYDIITKGHGGGLKVETVEGQGSEFIISLLCQ